MCKQFLDKSLYVMYTNFQNAISKKKSSILALGKLNQELTKEMYQNKYFLSDTFTNFFTSHENRNHRTIQIREEEEEVPDEGVDPLLESIGISRRLTFYNKFTSDIKETKLIPQKNSSTVAMTFTERPSNDFWSIPIKESSTCAHITKRKSHVNI